jgi:hypothetical protein
LLAVAERYAECISRSRLNERFAHTIANIEHELLDILEAISAQRAGTTSTRALCEG